ncbi:MAG: metal ABC transporter permease [Rhodothermales bacterium]|nr:metal ABC transporter permease [Rhodothermales bacterium]
MSAAQLEIQLIAVVVAAACALPGVFLVLRRMAMMSDAISHAILPGIVVAFFITGDLNHPLLIVAAAGMGILTVALVEAIHRTRLVHEDTAIGLVFPVMFSIGVILIARYAGSVHLDTDAVLLGELAFAPFDRLTYAGYDLGPRALWVMSTILAISVAFVALFYKELKLATFDPGLAASLGFAPALLHYVLMGIVSITAVGAFDAVGSILVVALMIAPPATAFLLTDRLSRMIAISLSVACIDAVAGYWLANAFDTSIAGSMATMAGVTFLAGLLFAPHRGLVALATRRRRQRLEFAAKMLTIHLAHHEGTPEALQECRVGHLEEHLNWEPDYARRVVRYTRNAGLIHQAGDLLGLTPAGQRFAQQAVLEV